MTVLLTSPCPVGIFDSNSDGGEGLSIDDAQAENDNLYAAVYHYSSVFFLKSHRTVHSVSHKLWDALSMTGRKRIPDTHTTDWSGIVNVVS